jgi:hypothetical protein
MNSAYTVKHKETGLFFGGFNADHSVKWVGESNAQHMDKAGASQQALLLTSFGIKAQKKPIAIN